ncbi:MAG: glycine/D-amino acid oxidases (deaminating) [halophilic archaeon J07HX5]|nr:MAG: glycine/D-amino acid oxidases (deaminating) [halophilic archaeon J07HX5]
MTDTPATTPSEPVTRQRITIIGGGVIGLTTALVLARRARATGHEYNIQVLEREPRLGSQSTTAAGCGLRTVYRHPVNIDLARKGLQFWANAGALFNGDIGFRRNGYLFLTANSETAATLERETTRQVAIGAPAEYDTPPVVPDVAPALNAGEYTASLFSSNAALATPQKIVDTVATAAAEAGVELRTDTAVTNLTPHDKGVTVEADGESEHADVMINATGAWADKIAGLAGETLPITADRRRLAVLDTSISSDAPLMVDIDTGMFMLPREDGKVYAGGKFRSEAGQTDPDDPAAFTTEVDNEYIDRLKTHGRQLYEPLDDATVIESWSGLYAMTDSHVPIIDRSRNMIHATGFSGHGIMQAPGAAMLIARMLDPGQTATQPLATLSRDRTVTTPDIQW